ncbi:LytTR family DNA-binding domain-containing protein [Ruegeria sp. Ofav3-42]|uniref:LytTR family DNA-binding domain-containing protein n=1 Tax=Ruegeria sp. Ofav3-42 TaxID=2917759 RepID=UPI001EF4263F|nr:LytTR family DNA-binding domain-containing protein [Ruegeria sp. Ofav3-42]MCG7522295.1 LytTR family transcriptional regulator [Ruegeria sp. Ofav3-42]
MQEAESREYQILLTNGQVMHFTQRELHTLVRSKRVWMFLVVSLVVIALANPTLFPSIPEYSARLFYWGVSVLLYLLIIPYWGSAVNGVWRRYLNVPLPLIVATGPLIIGLSFLATLFPFMFGDFVPQRGEPLVWTDYLRNLIIGHVIETVGLLWLLPLQRNEESEESSSKEETRFVILTGRSLPLENILMVQSSEHYLMVSTREKTSQYRARMKDFLQQTGETDGIQTHRSYWVSKEEAQELCGSTVKTRSGGEVPVSRGRLPEVRTWFRLHGKVH